MWLPQNAKDGRCLSILKDKHTNGSRNMRRRMTLRSPISLKRISLEPSKHPSNLVTQFSLKMLNKKFSHQSTQSFKSKSSKRTIVKWSELDKESFLTTKTSDCSWQQKLQIQITCQKSSSKSQSSISQSLLKASKINCWVMSSSTKCLKSKRKRIKSSLRFRKERNSWKKPKITFWLFCLRVKAWFWITWNLSEH